MRKVHVTMTNWQAVSLSRFFAPYAPCRRLREKRERETQGGGSVYSAGGRASPRDPRNATVVKPFDGTVNWDKVAYNVSEEEQDPDKYMPPAAQFMSFDSWRLGHNEIHFGGRGDISVRPWTGKQQ